MEDLAKAPLNQAHFLDRKAKFYAKQQLFLKSVQCRERAIENLELSRKCSLTDDTLISIQLQITHHQQQIRNLQERQRLKDSKMPSVTRVLASSKPTVTRPTSTSLEDAISGKSSSLEKKSEAVAKSQLELLIRKEILKGDLLLDHLVSQQRIKSDETEDTVDDESQKVGKAEQHKNEMICSAIKLPKPVEQVLEELQCHNSQLKSLMGNLFDELEALKLENYILTQRLWEYEKQSDLKDASREVAAPSDATAISPSTVDLPPLAPLEMPDVAALVLKPRVKVPPRKNTLSE